MGPSPSALAELADDAIWTPIETGESGGTVWRLRWPNGDLAYLKHGLGRVADAIADETARLRWCRDRLPVPSIRSSFYTPCEAWLLTDAVPGLTGDKLLLRDPAALSKIVRDCAALMRRFHALPIDDCPFDASHYVRLAQASMNVDGGLVDEDDFDVDHAGWSAAAMMTETVSLTPQWVERVVTHGDFSLGNILFDPLGRMTGCIDVGRLGIADPYQDIAVLWQNLREFECGAEVILLKELGISQVDEQRLQFHRCLDELF